MPRTASDRRCRLLSAMLLAGAAACPVAARAEPPTAEAMQAQLQGALSGVIGIDKTGHSPLSVTRQGSEYSILYAFTGMTPATADQPAGLVAKVHPLDAGRWSIDSVTLPPRATIVVPPLAGGLKDAVPGSIAYSLGAESGSGVFDPSYATPSALDLKASDVHYDTTTANQHTTSRYAGYLTHLSLTPHPGAGGAPSGVDMIQHSELTGMQLAGDGAAAFKMEAAKLLLDGTAVNTNPDRFGALYAALLKFTTSVIAVRPDAPQPGGPPPVDRAAMRGFVDQLQGLADKVDVIEAADGVRFVTTAGKTVSFTHFGIGLGGEATGGVLSTYLDLSLEALAASGADAPTAALLPRRLHFHPTFSGVGTTELMAVVDAAMPLHGEPDGATIGASVMGLFAHGGLKIGITDLSVELGDSALAATGQVSIPAPLPALIKGSGHVAVTHFDALLGLVQADPKAAQVAGVLAIAKQLGRPDGDTMIWDIQYQNALLTVNGHPLGPPRGTPPGNMQ